MNQIATQNTTQSLHDKCQKTSSVSNRLLEQQFWGIFCQAFDNRYYYLQGNFSIIPTISSCNWWVSSRAIILCQWINRSWSIQNTIFSFCIKRPVSFLRPKMHKVCPYHLFHIIMNIQHLNSCILSSEDVMCILYICQSETNSASYQWIEAVGSNTLHRRTRYTYSKYVYVWY